MRWLAEFMGDWHTGRLAPDIQRLGERVDSGGVIGGCEKNEAENCKIFMFGNVRKRCSKKRQVAYIHANIWKYLE